MLETGGDRLVCNAVLYFSVAGMGVDGGGNL